MGTRPTPAIDKNGIAWLAGEASGDYIASLVLPEVEKRFPGTPQYGVGYNDRILCITETVCRRYYRSSQIKN